jgi:hypothetical protein
MFTCDEEMKLLAYVSYSKCFKDKLHEKKNSEENAHVVIFFNLLSFLQKWK